MAGLLLGMIWLNAKLYFPPSVEPDFGKVPRHALAHLAWIREKLEAGAGEEMQQLFPEGYFFSHVLYGLAWVEIGLRSEGKVEDAVSEARWALANIESEKGKAPFSAELPPGHGMFYSGWRNHLLAGIVLLDGEADELAELRARCDELEEALENSPAWPWLASYHGQVWPCDAPPGIHAMRVFDQVEGNGRYADFIHGWLGAVSQNLDPEYGMVTHIADPRTGKPVGVPRGTSQVIVLRFLADIDPGFAHGQYRRFQENFVGNVLGMPGILEYPRGTKGHGDVDSGPLVAGVSVSASVVGMGVAQVYGDHGFSRATSQLGEVLGLPWGIGKRRYLGGVLPVGDAFVVHAMTARPWIGGESGMAVQGTPVSKFWRWGIHLLSAFAGGVLFLLWRWVSKVILARDQRSGIAPGNQC